MDQTAQRHRPTGWRTETCALANAQAWADLGQDVEMEKGRALIAVKQVSGHIGLKAAPLMLLDLLVGYSQPQDWKRGARPIVWPSNRLLMELSGFSLSALKRHLRHLMTLGLIAFRDSANGKRWGRRGRGGAIVEAFGFDLSPLAARAGEFDALNQQIKADRAERQRLRRAMTVLRRRLLSLEDLHWLSPRRRDLCLALLRRAQGGVAEMARIVALVGRILQRRGPKLDPNPTQSDPHIQSPTESPMKETIEPRQVLAACPTFREMSGMAQATWTEFVAAARTLAPITGIQGVTWERAMKRWGHEGTATSVALILEKTAQGLVSHPDLYLRGLLKRQNVDLRGSLIALQTRQCG